MTYASIKTLSLPNGWEPRFITVEAAVRKGLPRFQISGLQHARECADRIRQALQSTRERIPYAVLSVNLAPVDLTKRGGYFDLSIAAGLLKALESAPPGSLLDQVDDRTVFLGELSLSGAVQPLDRALPFLRGALALGVRRVIIPWANHAEAGLVPDLHCVPVRHLRDLLEGPAPTEPGDGVLAGAGSRTTGPRAALRGDRPALDGRGMLLSARMKRTLAIAAAGRHSLLLIGPPGSGKSSMARLLPALIAPPDASECLDILTLASHEYRDLGPPETGPMLVERPLRQPHHSVSDGAMIGGGRPLLPGEITRAHHGILLLDELAEFSRSALQNLREPLEEGRIRLQRGPETAEYPAQFQLVATTNPCPCGYTAFAKCNCAPGERQRYLSRLLGPLRDRIDMEFIVEEAGERTSVDRDWPEQLEAAVQSQKERFAGSPYRCNADIAASDLDRYCDVRGLEGDPNYADVRRRVGSFRRWDRTRRLARTVADLDGAAEIRPSDLLEAFSYRCLEEIWKENP